MHDFLDSVTSYTAGVSGAVLSMNWHTVGSEVLLWGSLLLLAVRLIADVPRAYRTLTKKRH